jgi:hypothetical protein
LLNVRLTRAMVCVLDLKNYIFFYNKFLRKNFVLNLLVYQDKTYNLYF